MTSQQMIKEFFKKGGKAKKCPTKNTPRKSGKVGLSHR